MLTRSEGTPDGMNEYAQCAYNSQIYSEGNALAAKGSRKRNRLE